MICIFLLRSLSSSPFSPVMSVPLNSILPAVGSISLKTSFPVVVFPQPLSPASVKISRFFIEKSMSSTALT